MAVAVTAGRLTAVSLGTAVAAAAFVLLGPVYTAFDGQNVTHPTFLDVNGSGAVIPVLAPVVFALAPVFFRNRAARVIAAVLIGGFALIAMSIGVLYLPAAILMAVAAAAEPAH